MYKIELDILNAVVKHKKVALDFSATVDANLFESDSAKKLANSFIKYTKSFKSKPSRKVLEDMHSTDEQMLICIDKFFVAIKDKDYNEDDYQYDLSKLKQHFGERRLESLKNSLNNSSVKDITGTIKTIEKSINEIKATKGERAYEAKTLDQYVDSFRENYIEKTKNPDLGKGILTGYSFFDYIKNGLRPADLIILAGETGAGKSLFMNNIAIQMWLQKNTVDTPADKITPGCNVMYFSLEMPYDDCFQRTMARVADVPSYGIRDAKLNKSEAGSISRSCKFIKNYPYKFDIIDVPRGFSVDQLEIMYEERKADYIPDVIFIDYMGLMEDIADVDDWLGLGKLAGKIHEFARAYSIPIVTAVQLTRMDPSNRKSEAKTIGLHRIGRSSLIAHHATAIIQIETRENEETHDDFVYHIIKNRHGQSNKSASVWKNFSKCSIIDKTYDIATSETWMPEEDISDDIANILAS
jgi:replicative DNA helicase